MPKKETEDFLAATKAATKLAPEHIRVPWRALLAALEEARAEAMQLSMLYEAAEDVEQPEDGVIGEIAEYDSKFGTLDAALLDLKKKVQRVMRTLRELQQLDRTVGARHRGELPAEQPAPPEEPVP